MKTVKERKAAVESGSLPVGGADQAVCRPPRQAMQTGKPAESPWGAADPSCERAELIERVRAQIRAGTYETPQKLHIAAERLLADIWDG